MWEIQEPRCFSHNEKRRFPWRAEIGAFHCGREINEEGEEKRKIRLPSPLCGGGEKESEGL